MILDHPDYTMLKLIDKTITDGDAPFIVHHGVVDKLATLGFERIILTNGVDLRSIRL